MGDDGKTIGVKIEKLTGKKNAVLDATVNVGEDAALPFEVADGWGEYKITFTRPTADDVITVTDIAIYTAKADESAAIVAPRTSSSPEAVYSLGGVRLTSAPAAKGVYVANGKKILKK